MRAENRNPVTAAKAKGRPADASDPKKRGRKGDEDVVSRIRERLGQAQEATDLNRRNYVEDTRFSSADDQWTQAAKQMRGADRPALTFNRLNGIVKQIIGDYRQNKLSVKVLPASGEASEEIAELLAGLIRNIEVQSNADMAYTTALECACRGGFGYFRILSEYTGDDVFDQNLVIRPIANPLTVYFDPAARLLTREDAEWCIVTETVSEDQFKRLYPKAKTTGFDAADGWIDDTGIRVAESYEKAYYDARLGAFDNGMVVEIKDDAEIRALEQIGIRLLKERAAQRTKILWKKVTGAEVLDEREYRMRYIPVIPVLGEEVNVEGKVLTRSAIFYAKDAQRMYNYFKSVATETIALAPRSPWLVTPEQIQGYEDQWARANTDPHPYLLFNHDPSQPAPQRIAPPDTPVGEITMAMNASDDIKATTGIYDASLGARSNETSGKAIVARQQQGANATFVFLDNLKEAIQYCGRVLIDMIPTVYDAERVVRVLDLEGNPKSETINEHRYDPLTGVTEILNSITVGKYDAVVEAGPSFANRKAEALAGMSQLISAYPPIMDRAGDLVVKNMDWPGANEIAERLKRSMPPEITTDPDSPEGQQAQAQAQAAQQQQAEQAMQLEQGRIAAENAKSQATIAKANADVVKAEASTMQAAAPAPASAAPQAAEQAVSQPTNTVTAAPPVSIQFNAEEALSGIGQRIEGMAQASVQSVGQVMQVVEQLLATTARSTEMIAASLQGQQQLQAQQAEAMLQVGEQNAAALQEVAEAIEHQTAVMKAPRLAVRDSKGNIVASEVKV